MPECSKNKFSIINILPSLILLCFLSFVSPFFLSSQVHADNIEAVLDSTDGSSALVVQDSATTEVMRVNSLGNLGIGTTAPVSKLDVRGDEVRVWTGAGTNTNATASGELYVEGDLEVDGTLYATLGGGVETDPTLINDGVVSFGAGAGDVTLTLNADAGVDGTLVWDGGNDDFSMIAGNFGLGTSGPMSKLDVEGGAVIGASYSGSFTAPVNGLIVEGNVGIGTTNPQAPLEMSSANFPVARIVRTSTSTNVVRSTFAAQHTTTGNMVDGFGADVSFQIRDNAGVNNEIANFGGVRDGGDNSGALVFLTYASGSQLNRMIIKSGGNVGIGTTVPLNLLHVAGDIRIGTGTNGCVYDADGTTLTGTCSSDSRFKKNITPLKGILSKMMALEPVYYQWRSEEFPGFHWGTQTELGLIAQDVEKVFPEMVSMTEEGYRNVAYHQLPIMLLGALREFKDSDKSFMKNTNE